MTFFARSDARVILSSMRPATAARPNRRPGCHRMHDPPAGCAGACRSSAPIVSTDREGDVGTRNTRFARPPAVQPRAIACRLVVSLPCEQPHRRAADARRSTNHGRNRLRNAPRIRPDEPRRDAPAPAAAAAPDLLFRPADRTAADAAVRNRALRRPHRCARACTHDAAESRADGVVGHRAQHRDLFAVAAGRRRRRERSGDRRAADAVAPAGAVRPRDDRTLSRRHLCARQPRQHRGRRQERRAAQREFRGRAVLQRASRPARRRALRQRSVPLAAARRLAEHRTQPPHHARGRLVRRHRRDVDPARIFPRPVLAPGARRSRRDVADRYERRDGDARAVRPEDRRPQHQSGEHVPPVHARAKAAFSIGRRSTACGGCMRSGTSTTCR